MLVLARAVRRGLRTPLLIGDLPFGSYEVSDEQAITTAMRMVKEAGCDVVKLEGGGEASVQPGPRDRRRGHPGDGPRRPHAPDLDRPRRLEGPGPHRRRRPRASPREALALQEVGCFALVFEAIPSAVTEELMGLLEIPVIGIGAGPATDGQVLVFHDLLGIRDGLGAALRQALRQPPAGDERRRQRLRRGRALAPLPRPRAHLLDRPRRAGRAAGPLG